MSMVILLKYPITVFRNVLISSQLKIAEPVTGNDTAYLHSAPCAKSNIEVY